MAEIRTENYNSTKDNSKASYSSKWWTQDQKHNHVYGVIQHLKSEQSYRNLMNLKHARLYANMRLEGLSAYDYSKINTMPTNRLTLNVIRAVVETASAKIAKNKPRALFLTQRGDQSEQTRGKLLSDYIFGLFSEKKVYKEGQKQFTEGAVFGTGAMKVFQEHDELKIEKCLIDEIYIDDLEALYGRPQNMYQARCMNREMLLELCTTDEQRMAVEAARDSADSNRWSHIHGADMVTVYEAWHLPSSKKANDGRHVICVENATIFEEEWKKNYFPFVFFKWSDPLCGFYGSGIPQSLTGLQIEINRMLRNISESTDLFAKPRVFMQKGSSITKPLDNKIGGVYDYVGSVPTFMTPSAMSPDIYNHLERLYNKGFEITGVSQLSATGRKPSGLDSGVAIREYNDIETERFSIVAQDYESGYIELSKLVIAETRDLQAKKGNTSVKTKTGKFMSKIDWTEVDLDDEKFIMQAFPANMLPATPAGRLEKVQEMVKAGFVDKAHAMSLLDFPDVEQFISLETAAVDDAKFIIDKILNEGEYEQPDPLMNIQLSMRMMNSAYLRAKRDGVSEDRLNLMRDFLNEGAELMLQSAPPPAPPQQQGLPPQAPVEGQLPIEIAPPLPQV